VVCVKQNALHAAEASNGWRDDAFDVELLTYAMFAYARNNAALSRRL